MIIGICDTGTGVVICFVIICILTVDYLLCTVDVFMIFRMKTQLFTLQQFLVFRDVLK